MKKIYRIFILLAISIGIPLQWSDGQSPTINLYRPATGNQLHEATQNITLSAGFSYDAQNLNTFNARVVPANGQAYNFTEPTDNSSTSVNTAYLVGSIEGSWSVGSTGGATYSIPVKLPPGIGDMMPNLSVVYNSQSGEGLLGRGWNISGISKITRVASDLYHEGYIDYLHFGSEDHFALDGQRLIPDTSTATYTEYRTEIESFSRIIAYGPIGNPTYFVLESKDGKIIEYGHTRDSRIELQGSPGFIWNVNKISDKNGNYITETYYKDSINGEYHPLNIKYTGTASKDPFNTIQFEYQPRNEEIDSYVSGHVGMLYYLLKNIVVKSEGDTASQFKFLYNSNDRLTEIAEYGKNSSRINSSTVNWGTANTGLSEFNSFTDTQVSGRYQGDFNGDGKTDFVIVKGSTWYLNLADGSGSFYQANSGPMPLNVQSVYPGDFNGDGKKDLLIVRLISGIDSLSLLISTGSNFTTYDTHTNKDVIWPRYSSSCSYQIGDFNGDGKDEYLAYGFYSDGSENYDISGWDFGTTLTFHSFDQGTKNWGTKVYSNTNNVALDINGDGKADLMVVDADGAYFYELDEHTNLTQILKVVSPILNSTVNFLFGDFNGDGLTDIATYDKNTIWYIYISTGDNNGFYNPMGFISFSGFYTTTNLNNFYAQDIDGDGKCDLVAVGRGHSTTDSVKIYVSYSTGPKCFQHLPVTYSPRTKLNIQQNDPITSGDYNHFDDFNGDGTCDYYYNDGSTGRMFTIFNGTNQQLVASVKNGFNLSSGVNYKPLTDNTVYSTGRLSSTYPLMDYQGPLYVVSSAWADNISGAPDVTNYTYNGARIHKLGKGFLGFQWVTSSNSLHNIQISDLYEFNPTYFNVSLSQRSIYPVNGRDPISTLSYTNSLIEYGNQRILPYVSQAININSLIGISKTTVFSIDNNGNPLSTTETFDDGSYNTSAYSNYSSEGSWLAAKPQNVTITKKHYSDSQPFSLSTAFTYQPGTGLVLTDTTGLLTTSYQYNDNGTLKQVSQSDGTTHRVNRFEYDTKGRFVTNSYNALNHLTQRTYDNATGNILTETAPNGQVTSFTYDNFGRQTGITYPTGQSAAISYNWATDTRPANAIYYKLTTSSGLPSVKEYYDGFGRVLRTEKTGFDGTSIYSSIAYNTKGQVTQSSLPFYAGQQALAKTYTYDDFGRLITEAGPSGTTGYTYSGKTTQVVTGPGQVSSKTVDSQGNVVSSADEGGSITYAYKSHGKPGVITTNGVSVSMGYDIYGRQTQLTDPDAGTTTYCYSGYNELNSQMDPKDTISIKYDVLGRDSIRTGKEGTTKYTYDPAGNPGLLSSVTYPGGSESYSYDTYGRLTGTSKIINDGSAITYTYGYNYDTQGRVTGITYPSGFSTTNYYNYHGYLETVQQTDYPSVSIWYGQKANALGQFTQSQFGNGLTNTKTYSNIGLLSNIHTETVQNLNYNFDPGTGNLLSRSDVLRSLTETFTYDNSNRLANISGPSSLGIVFNNNGNITSKTGVGDYTYGSQPHAVSQVSNPQNLVSTVTQTINYTPFNKVDNISEGTASLQYTYDGNRQRTIAKFYQNSVLQKTTHYVGNYEKETIGSNVRQINYIYGGDGLAAIYVINNGVDTMYYVHTDMLGSYDVITDPGSAVVQNYSFDAWGRRRNPTNWTYANMPAHSLFSRGYTGHEHLDAFNLVNMNGRVYDPMLGRFLSPDNIIQAPGNSQSYNRYSYCLNNPFAYTDPSGYSVLSNFGDWVNKSFDKLGDWLNKNDITIGFGYNTTLSNPGGGTPYVGATVDGNNISVGYNLDSGQVGIGTNNGGPITNFSYLSDNTGQSEQTANNTIEDVRAVYFNSGGGVDRFHNDRQALNQIGDFFNKGQYSIPVWGACLQAGNCLNNGDYAGWAVNFGLGFVEAFTLGYGTGYRFALNSATEGTVAFRSVGAAGKEVFNPSNFKAVSQSYLKSIGIEDIHAFKAEWLGTNQGLKLFDVVKNTATNELLIIRKTTQEVVERTYIIGR